MVLVFKRVSSDLDIVPDVNIVLLVNTLLVVIVIALFISSHIAAIDIFDWLGVLGYQNLIISHILCF